MCDFTTRVTCVGFLRSPPMLRDVPPRAFMCSARTRIKQASAVGSCVWENNSFPCSCHHPAVSVSHVPSGWMLWSYDDGAKTHSSFTFLLPAVSLLSGNDGGVEETFLWWGWHRCRETHNQDWFRRKSEWCLTMKTRVLVLLGACLPYQVKRVHLIVSIKNINN